MLIKYTALSNTLTKQQHAFYLLMGQDHYLMNDAALQIKQAWKKQGDFEEKSLSITQSADWHNLVEEANHYTLFSDHCLIRAYYEKKTLDKEANAVLNHYLKAINPKTRIILQAANVSPKKLTTFSQHQQVCVVQMTPFTPNMMQSWIGSQLQKHALKFTQEVPLLIHQYTQGNMLACAQVIEKLALVNNEYEQIDANIVSEYLMDQCEYQLFELSDFCLSGLADKAIHCLRHAKETKQEPTLILWLISQEIRQLMALKQASQQHTSFHAACKQLNIWSSKQPYYQKAIQRLSRLQLFELIRACEQLDMLIKSSDTKRIWMSFESMILKFCGIYS